MRDNSPDDDRRDLAIVINLRKIPRPPFDYGCPLGEAVGEFDEICHQLMFLARFSEFVRPISVEIDKDCPVSYVSFLCARLWRLAERVANFETRVGVMVGDGGARRFLRTWAEQRGNLLRRLVGAWGKMSTISDDPGWHRELFEDHLDEICSAWKARVAG